MNEQVKTEKSLKDYWNDFLMSEFKNETDRGAVLLTTSLLDNALTALLKKLLVPISSTDDELFDRPTSPLSSLSSKIQIAHRLGLISARLARDLNLIRKMRNEFAHNVHGSNLDSGKIKDLLTNLCTSSGIVKGFEGLTFYPPGSRGEFLKVANIMLYHLHALTESQTLALPLKGTADEWIYEWKYSPPTQAQITQSPESPTK